jgi:hypothetical protein
MKPNVARILPALILYHHRRDQALGLAYPGRVTRELIYQYERVKREQADQAKEIINKSGRLKKIFL